MKIPQINDNYEIVGGAETYFKNLVDLQRRKGFDVYVYSFGETKVNEQKKIIQKISKFKTINYFYRFVFNYSAYLNLKKYIKKVKPEIIHLHKIDNKSVSSILLACKGKKVVYTVHDCGQICLTGWCTYKDTLTECSGKYGIKCVKRKCIPKSWFPPLFLGFKIRDKLTKKLANIYLCPSNMLKNKMIINGYKNCIKFPYFMNIKKQKKEILNTDTFVYIGRLSKEKGVEYLIEAVSYMKNEDSKLIIIGDGPEKSNLENQTKKLKLEKQISFLGKINHDEISKYYENYNLFIVPSIWQENYPLTILEAMSYGNVVVGSRIGGIKEMIVDNKTGFLTNPKDSKDISLKMNILFKNKKMIEKMSKEAKKIIKKNNDPEQHIIDLKRIYDDALKNKTNS